MQGLHASGDPSEAGVCSGRRGRPRCHAAPQRMAAAARRSSAAQAFGRARGSTVPISPPIIPACIAAVLGVWTLYALSGAGVIRRLPFLRLALTLIAAVYLARGIPGIPVVTP